jgi:uncharacterized membrane protein YedE/YeeE
MKNNAVAFVTGFLFAIGLGISGMTKPEKVQGFLDIFGTWDPSLLFTIGGAVSAYAIVFRISQKFDKPFFAAQFSVPTKRELDPKLLGGSILFGFGWGLSGYCPAPALVAAGGGVTPVLVFLASMLLGMWVFSIANKRYFSKI